MKRKTVAGLIAIVVITSVAIFAGCVEKDEVISLTPTPSEPSIIEDLGDKNILMVIAPKDFRDEELFEPKEIFEEKGAEVTIASTTTEIAKGMLGGTAKPDLKISDVNVENYDAIVIVGGAGSKEYLGGDEGLRALVKEAYNKDKVLAAICLSPVVLAKAGVLNGKKATVFPDKEAINELKKNGAYYIDKNVVVSDNVITGRDTENTEEFALKICDALTSLSPENRKENSRKTSTETVKKLSKQPKPYLSFGSWRGARNVTMVYTSHWHADGKPKTGYSPIIVGNRGDPGTIEVKLIKLKCKEGSWEEDKVLNTTSVFLDKMEEKELRFKFYNPGYFGEERYKIRALVNGQTATNLTLTIPKSTISRPPIPTYNPPPPPPIPTYNPPPPPPIPTYNPPPYIPPPRYDPPSIPRYP